LIDKNGGGAIGKHYAVDRGLVAGDRFLHYGRAPLKALPWVSRLPPRWWLHAGILNMERRQPERRRVAGRCRISSSNHSCASTRQGWVSRRRICPSHARAKRWFR